MKITTLALAIVFFNSFAAQAQYYNNNDDYYYYQQQQAQDAADRAQEANERMGRDLSDWAARTTCEGGRYNPACH
jgi:hypothetical protein